MNTYFTSRTERSIAQRKVIYSSFIWHSHAHITIHFVTWTKVWEYEWGGILKVLLSMSILEKMIWMPLSIRKEWTGHVLEWRRAKMFAVRFFIWSNMEWNIIFQFLHQGLHMLQAHTVLFFLTLSVSCHSINSLWLVLQGNSWKEGRFNLVHGFRGFSSKVADTDVSGPMVRQSIMSEDHGTTFISGSQNIILGRKWAQGIFSSSSCTQLPPPFSDAPSTF